MFEHLATFGTVLVTGPHRSGTTICAEMIAHDAGHAVYREESFGPDNVDAWLALIRRTCWAVIQCPSMCGHLSKVYGLNVAVVLMRRDMVDILRSQAKINFRAGGPLESRYIGELANYGIDKLGRNLAEVKYEAWEQQRARLRHPFEVSYESLAAHPLWIPKERRVDWGTRQTHE